MFDWALKEYADQLGDEKMKKWAQNVDTSGIDLKSSRYLNIPDRKKIPKTLLKRLKNAKIGSTIKNPTKTGKQRIKVTKKLKQKVVFAWNINYA